MNTRLIKLPLLAGTAATALLLSACGSDGAAEAPAPQVTVTTTVAPSAPASSATPSASASAPTSSTPSSTASASSSASGETIADDRAELDVEDQRGDGRSVAVEEVRLTSGTGFVAVYTPDDRLLGSAEVSGGGNGSRLTVDLDDRIPATGEDYRAVLFADEGDGSFDPATDLRVVEGDDDGDDDDADAVDDEFDFALN